METSSSVYLVYAAGCSYRLRASNGNLMLSYDISYVYWYEVNFFLMDILRNKTLVISNSGIID